MFLVCERWVGDGDRLRYWPKVLLTIAALLSHLGWVVQPWVTEGPKPSVYRWFSIRHLVYNSLTPSLFGYIIVWTYTCFRCSSAYLHRCISWLTARSRVNMLQYVVWVCLTLNCIWWWGSSSRAWKSCQVPRNFVVSVLNSELEPQSHYQFPFRTNNLEKGVNPFIPTPAMG